VSWPRFERNAFLKPVCTRHYCNPPVSSEFSPPHLMPVGVPCLCDCFSSSCRLWNARIRIWWNSRIPCFCTVRNLVSCIESKESPVHYRPCFLSYANKQHTDSVALVCETTISTERPQLVGALSANFLRIEGCSVVSATDLRGCNLGFLDRSPIFSSK
jgi:hypothetical protein